MPPETDQEVYDTLNREYGKDAARLIRKYDTRRASGQPVRDAAIATLFDELDAQRRKLSGLLGNN